jgi:hypothetical protein
MSVRRRPAFLKPASYDGRHYCEAMQAMYLRVMWLIGLVLLAAGCGGCGGSSPEAAGDLKHREIASLPAVGDYLPPIDDGRLAVAPPADWSVLPRGRTYLLGLARGKPTELPRILVNAEEPPPESPEELTEENAAAFAELQDAELQQVAKQGKKKVHEYHLPIVLGETAFVRHVRQASLGAGTPCIVQSLQTIRGGRLYTVELLVQIDAAQANEYGQALTEARDYGYAVAAHLKFAPPGEKLDPSALERAAAESPAETKSDEKNPIEK